jgi:hypothetical protein
MALTTDRPRPVIAWGVLATSIGRDRPVSRTPTRTPGSSRVTLRVIGGSPWSAALVTSSVVTRAASPTHSPGTRRAGPG